MITTSLYFHIPFCIRRCGYCDFNTFAGMQTYLDQYVEALCQEQKIFAQAAKSRINIGTIFFGGGTPSLLSILNIKSILTVTNKCFNLQNPIEVTLEANPGTVNLDYLKAIHDIGINRISFGMQSAHPGDLRMLNRQHHHADVINAVMWSKLAGFEHINLDLIFGIPDQTLLRWINTLDIALMENVDHLSLYSLSVEEGTPLKKWVDHGAITAPDEDLAADMYEAAMDKLGRNGYEQYEISNWARRGIQDYRCQHNLQYWHYLPYLGFGAGAHGFYNGIRTENVGGILEYIRQVKNPSRESFPIGPACNLPKTLTLWDQMQEYLMVGFRLTEDGVSKAEFMKRFTQSMDEIFRIQIERLLKQGLIEVHPSDQDRLRLSKRGRLFGNRVFAEFVGNRIPENFK